MGASAVSQVRQKRSALSSLSRLELAISRRHGHLGDWLSRLGRLDGLGLLREQHNRAPRVGDVTIRGIELDFVSGFEKVLTAWKARVDGPVPPSIGAKLRERDPLRFVVCVQYEEQAVHA